VEVFKKYLHFFTQKVCRYKYLLYLYTITKNKYIMTTSTMKTRVANQLAKMGYAKEAEQLIKKYWNQVEHLTTARAKAEYMIA